MALGSLQTKEKVQRRPPAHLTAQRASSTKPMCRQKLRNEVPAARNLALSCHPRSACRLVCNRPSPAHLTDSSRFISGSVLQWRISDGASSFVGKGRQPILVDARGDLIPRPARGGGILPPAQAFD